LGLLAQLTGTAASSAEGSTVAAYRDQVAGQRTVPEQTVAAASDPTPVGVKPLWLPVTRSDWDSIASKARLTATGPGSGLDGRFEEITVTAPAELLPMNENVYDRMWGGILAPVWALVHPTQAWRIFLPIPPE
jgi:hypothetical protein